VDNDVTFDDPAAAAWSASAPSAIWEVSLGHPQDIHGLKIYKSDNQAAFFENVTVEVHRNGTIVHTEGPFSNTVSRTHYVRFSEPVEADLVRRCRQCYRDDRG
jgi:F5/8 type C domain